MSSRTRSNPDPSSEDTLSTFISPTFVISLSPKVVAPRVTEPVVESALDPISIAPNPLVIDPALRAPVVVTFDRVSSEVSM